MQRSAGLMAMFVPGHKFQETQNKIEAFRLFAFVDKELNFSKDRLEELPAMVCRARRLGNYKSIWAMEGIAHFYTAAAISERRLRGLLADPELPESAMVPLHAGMGTAYAGHLLKQLGGAPSGVALRDAMEQFFEFCQENSRAGWVDNAVEPLGLAVRSTHPHLMAQVSDALGALDGHAQQLFWHGAGRSLYFVPTNFAAFGSAHARALRSAIEMPEAVVNGITSAFMVWKHMVPGDAAFLPQYLRLQDDLWNERVAEPALAAFAEVYPELLRQGRVATLFSYRGVHE